MIKFITKENSLIQYFLNELCKTWNKKNFYETEKYISYIKKNSFISNENKEIIIREYYTNLKLINIVRKITMTYHLKKEKKLINSHTLLFESAETIPYENLIDIGYGDNIFRFDKYELIRIYDNAIFNSFHKFPKPKLASNPYTGSNFTCKEFYTIYQQLKSTSIKLPISFTLLNLSLYDIDVLLKNHYDFLKDMIVSKSTNELSDIDFYKKIRRMFSNLDLTFCICCIKKNPFIRNKLTFIYKKWITEPDNDQVIIEEIETLIPEFVNIDSHNHNLIYHRKAIKKFKRNKNIGPKFDVPQFNPSTINDELYIFKANKNTTTYHEILINRKNKLFLRKKRGMIRKQKLKKSNNIISSLENDISFITERINISDILNNHEFMIDDTARTRRSRSNITITTQLEFIS